MKTHLLSFAVFLLYVPHTSAADNAEDWQSIELGQSGDLTVRLRIKPKTSLADKDWIAIEFDNRGNQEIKIDHAHYRIESVRHNLQTGISVSSGGLASGSNYDLFPDAWKTTPVADRMLKPGVYRMIDHPSLYSSALLGLPSKDGLLVNAEIFVDLRIEKQKLVRLGGKFEFQWPYPDEAGFVSMRKRLVQLLANPRGYVQHAYILHTLLKIPEVASATSAPELIDAIDPRMHSFSGREYVLQHLNDHYSDEPMVVDYFFDRLVDGDKRITQDLRRVSKVWEPRFLAPLLERFARDRDSVNDIFEILRQRGTPQQSAPKIAQRLSAALLDHGWLEPDQKYDPFTLAHHLTLMGRTRDREMIPRLMPYLDDKTQTIEPRQLSSINFRLPPLRVCDNALEAILQILDGGPDKAYKAAGFGISNATGFDPSNSSSRQPRDGVKITKIRDKMIATLKQRLAELKIQPKP